MVGEGRLGVGVEKYIYAALWLAALASLWEIIVGLVLGILVMVADGLHMLMDVAVLAFLQFGVRMMSKPPDLDHPYGHYKYRYLSMYTVSIVIIGASVWLAWEAARAIYTGSFEALKISYINYTFITLALILTRAVELKIGHSRFKDVLLDLEFKHALADLADSSLVSVAVLASAFVSIIQPIAVLAIVGYLIYLALMYFKQSVGVLVDQVSPGLKRTVESIASEEGLVVSSVSIKNVGNGYAIDIVVKVPSWYNVKMAHDIVDEFEKRIRREMPYVVDVNTHVEPL